MSTVFRSTFHHLPKLQYVYPFSESLIMLLSGNTQTSQQLLVQYRISPRRIKSSNYQIDSLQHISCLTYTCIIVLLATTKISGTNLFVERIKKTASVKFRFKYNKAYMRCKSNELILLQTNWQITPLGWQVDIVDSVCCLI